MRTADPSRSLDGQVALVSGAARGIGRATADRLAADGARVMLADIQEPASALGRRMAYTRLDVTDAAGWDRAVEEVAEALGRLSILVNAAGILETGSIEDISLADWRRVMAVNLDGVFYGCRAGVRAMNRGGGSIVNLASTSGLRADPRTPAYDASKAGVAALSKEVAVGCGRRDLRIRCNSVHPGSVDTAMMAGIESNDSELHRDWVAASPTARLARPDEIAAMVSFLASPAAAFITGAEFVIDGGASI